MSRGRQLQVKSLNRAEDGRGDVRRRASDTKMFASCVDVIGGS